MFPKESLPLESRDEYVRELRTYVRWSKRLFYALIAVMVVNLILTYGLIFHPSKPSVDTCASFCPKIHTRGALDTVSFSEPHPDMLQSTELATTGRETTDIDVRNTETDVANLGERWDYGDVRTGVALAMVGYWVTNQAIQWWNMVSACQDVSSASNAINCVWGAVSTVITAAGTLYGGYVGVGHISTWMNNNGISIGNLKRQEVEQGLLDELSVAFGGEVTHLGVWNHVPAPVAGRRTVGVPRDVFGLNSNGMDLHFSYLGNTTAGLTFKIGYGTGQQLSAGNSSKRAETYDAQYFESGGIDFVIQDVAPNSDYPSGAALDSYTDYSWIYDQVACIMDSGMSAAGHWFQIFDNVHQDTIAAGAVAPFSGLDHWSVITQMTPKGGINIDSACGTVW